MNKEKKYIPPEKYPHAKHLAKEYNDLNSKKNFQIDKELPRGVLLSYRMITVLLFLFTVLFAVFKSPLAYERLVKSFRDLYTSVVYYSLMFFEDLSFNVTVNDTYIQCNKSP